MIAHVFCMPLLAEAVDVLVADVVFRMPVLAEALLVVFSPSLSSCVSCLALWPWRQGKAMADTVLVRMPLLAEALPWLA